MTCKHIKQYLINLDHRKDRLLTTQKLLKDYGFNHVQRYPAVNGKKMTEDELKSIVVDHAMPSILQNYRHAHHELSYGAVGCYLSHVNIWKKGLYDKDDKNDMILIFEDDTYPSYDLTTLDEYLKYVPSDWDIVFLGGEYNNTEPINEYVSKLIKFYRTHGYIIRKKCIPYLLNNAFPIEKQIDSWLSDISLKGDIQIYGFIKDSWGQNEEIAFTDIQTPLQF
jgi:GR25 family glycosyltransferase involved in LPS biosynthesis